MRPQPSSLPEELTQGRAQAVLIDAVEAAGFSGRLISKTDGGADRTVTLHVTGMTCSSCSSAVEKALRAQLGVKSATVNLLANRAEVTKQLVRPWR